MIRRGNRHARGLELGNAADDALIRWGGHERKQVADGFPAERSIGTVIVKQRLQLRGEDELAVPRCVVQRLDAEAIACEQYPTLPAVPDGEGEHAPQMLHAPGAEILVKVHDGFGVTRRPQLVASGFEQIAQLLVVVDLAVEHDPNGSVFVRNRLVAVVQIDDAEAPHAEGNAVGQVDAFVVWSAVDHGVAHPADFVFEDWTPVPSNDSGYATHRRILSITV